MLLTRFLDITTPPTPNLLRYFASIATNTKEQTQLNILATVRHDLDIPFKYHIISYSSMILANFRTRQHTKIGNTGSIQICSKFSTSFHRWDRSLRFSFFILLRCNRDSTAYPLRRWSIRVRFTWRSLLCNTNRKVC